MSRIAQIQTSFTVGAIDPLLRARVDLKQYYQALEQAKNVLIQPQGGFTRRPGLRWLMEIPSAAAPQSGCRLIPFEVSTTQSFMFLVAHQRIYIFADQVLQTNINGTGNDFLATTIASANIPTMYWTQSVDTLILVDEDMAPKQITRGANNSTWTIADIAFSSMPRFGFDIVKYTPRGEITPSSTTADNITLTHNYGGAATGTAQAGASGSITLHAGADSNDDFFTGMYVTITANTGSGQSRLITDYDGSTKVASVTPNWDTNPDSTSTFKIVGFADPAVGQYVNDVDGFGRARIVKVNSDTVAEAVNEVPFGDTSAIGTSSTAGAWELETGYEDAWSSTRGYPRTATYHESRLWFGGSKSLPNTLWGSRVDDTASFEIGDLLDDDAIIISQNTDQANAIVAMRSGRDLQIFTTGGEFFVPQSDLDPLTPSNMAVKSATRRGAMAGIRPAASEGGTLFIQRQGKALREFSFSDVDLSYVSENISLLSSHLIVSPLDMAMRPAISTNEGDLLMICNGSSTADTRTAAAAQSGTLATFMLDRSQSVVAPSFFQTDGEFRNVGVDIDEIYVVVKRTVNSATKYYLEVFDDDRTTDASIQYYSGAVAPDQSLPGGTAASSLSHLEAKSVSVIVDDDVQTSKTVSSGAITLDAAGTSYLEVGLDYDVEVKTMPFETRLASGNVQGQRRRVIEASPILDNTQNLAVNGNEIPFRELPLTLGQGVQAYTGTKRIAPLLGYTRDAQVTMTMTKPLFCTVLGIDYKVSVGQ